MPAAGCCLAGRPTLPPDGARPQEPPGDESDVPHGARGRPASAEESKMIEVVDGGLQTTIQDGGRPGYLSRGIPPAGAQDFYSLAVANLLVGNEPTPPPLSRYACGAAGLEMLLKGVGLRFGEETVIALA